MKHLVVFLLYGGGIVALGVWSGHPIIGILLAAIVIVSLYFAVIGGYIEGARYALKNPPPPGNTRIALKVSGQEIIFGEEFTFNPPAPDGQAHNFIVNGGGRKKYSYKDNENINDPDVMAWHKEAKRILENEPFYKFVEFCNAAGKNESTVRSRLKNLFT